MNSIIKFSRRNSMTVSIISDHYARPGLLEAIEDGILALGKTTETVSVDDLTAVDEFHIGGRRASEEIFRQLQPSATDQP